MSKTDKVAIKVSDVTKTFKLPHEKHNSIKSLFVNLLRNKRTFEKQRVLDGVSFDIKKGEFFGIVGRNGSGKSTLLKLLAGIYSPDSGKVQVNGRLTPFIELGVGFNPELTGHENVFLNGALLGFGRKEMEEMYDDIVDFAELDKFMDQKLKNYSSGMQVRLAFSIAIRANSDILLLDEVLAVGDAAFQAKCFDYFYDIKKKGATVVFVSHDRTALERFCDRGVLIHDGKLVEEGSIKKIMKTYSSIILNELDKSTEHTEEKPENKTNIDKRASIVNTRSLDSTSTSKRKFVYGEAVTVSFEAEILRDMDNPIFGVTVWQKHVDSKPVYASNTLIEGMLETGSYKKGQSIAFSVTLPSLLNDGEYIIEPAVANESGTVFYDQKPNAATFIINGSNNPYSIISSDERIELDKNE